MKTNRSSSIRTQVSRREFLRLAGLGGGAAFLAACSPAATAAPTTAPTSAATAVPATAAPTAAAPANLSFWVPGGAPVFCPGAMTSMTTAYTAMHPNVTFQEVQCGAAGQNFNEALLARIAAGNPPDTTIIWDSPIALAARGSLEPLDARMAASQYSMAENWPAAVLASCQFEGQTWGLPIAAGTYGMFFNSEMFEAKGVPSDRASFPKTWDDMRELSKKFTEWDGDTLQTAGFVPIPDNVNLAIWAAANGGALYDAANKKYTIDTPANVAMMQYFLDWLEEEYKGDFNKVKASGAWGGFPGPEGQPAAFQQNRLAMMIEGFWMVGSFYNFDPQFERWDVAGIPVGPGGSTPKSGYWPNWMVIPVGSANPDAAFGFMDYVSGDGMKLWFAAIPDLPVNKAVPADLVPDITIEKRGQEFAQEVTDFFRGQLDVATPMWDSPVQNFSNDQLTRAIEQVLSKAATPEAAMAEAQAASQAELERVL